MGTVEVVLNEEKIVEAVRMVRRVQKMRKVLQMVERDTRIATNDLIPGEQREMKRRLSAMDEADRKLKEVVEAGHADG